MKEKERIERLKSLLETQKNDEYVDYIRERWSDEDVVAIYHYARRLEKKRMQRVISTIKVKLNE